MKTLANKPIAWIMLGIVLALCVAGTKYSQITQTDYVPENGLILVVTNAGFPDGSRAMKLSNFVSRIAGMSTFPGSNGIIATNYSTTNATRFGVVHDKLGNALRFYGLETGTNIVLYRNGSNIVVNATGTGTGGSSAINLGAMVWVSTNGNDSTGVRNDPSKPFLTCTNAKNAAIAGDTIIVAPGYYNERMLLKDQVNWYFHAGAVVTNYNTTNNAVGGWGIFDDRITGPVRCTIDGAGIFEWGYNGVISTNGLGIFVSTNSATKMFVKGKRAAIYVPALNPSSGVSIVFQKNGTNQFIFDEWVDLNYGGTNIVVDEGNQSDGGNAVYWERGDLFVQVPYSKVEGYTIWTEKGSTTAIVNDLYFNGETMISRSFPVVYHDGESISPNQKTWVSARQIIAENLDASGTITAFGGGKVYVVAEKIQHTSGSGRAINIAAGSPQVWITTQKLTATNQWLRLASDATSAELYLDCMHYEDLGNVGKTVGPGFDLSGGYPWINQGVAQVDAGTALLVGVGLVAADINGLILDTSTGTSVTNLPIRVQTNGLTLRNVRLIAPSIASNSISAVAAWAVQVDGALSANKTNNANVVLRGGTFSVGTNYSTITMPQTNGLAGQVLKIDGSSGRAYWADDTTSAGAGGAQTNNNQFSSATPVLTLKSGVALTNMAVQSLTNEGITIFNGGVTNNSWFQQNAPAYFAGSATFLAGITNTGSLRMLGPSDIIALDNATRIDIGRSALYGTTASGIRFGTNAFISGQPELVGDSEDTKYRFPPHSMGFSTNDVIRRRDLSVFSSNIFSPTLSNTTIKPLVVGVGNAAGATNTSGQIRGLEAGSNVTLSENGSNVVIAATGGGSGTPIGVESAVQYVSNSLFQGSANFRYDSTNRIVLIFPGSSTAPGLKVADGSTFDMYLTARTLFASNGSLTLQAGSSANAMSISSSSGNVTPAADAVQNDGGITLHWLTNFSGIYDGTNLVLRHPSGNGGYTAFSVATNPRSTNVLQFAINSNSVSAGQIFKFHSVTASGGINTIVLTNDVDNSAGGITTNGNQFGAQTVITIKDTPFLTNVINTGLLVLTNAPGQQAGLVRLTGTNGPWYTEIGITNAAVSTNRFLFSIGSNTVAASQVLKIHATAISSGINTITLTNDSDVSSGGVNTNANQFGAAAATITIKDTPFITNSIVTGVEVITNAPGQQAGLLRLTGTNGPWYTEIGITNAAVSTNRILFSLGSNTVAAAQVFKVHATAISGGINTITITNDTDSTSAGSSGVQTNASQFAANVVLNIKDGAVLTNIVVYGAGLVGALTNHYITPGFLGTNVVFDGGTNGSFYQFNVTTGPATNFVFTNIQAGQTIYVKTFVTNGATVRLWVDTTEIPSSWYVGNNGAATSLNSNTPTLLEVSRRTSPAATNVLVTTRQLEAVAGHNITMVTNLPAGTVSLIPSIGVISNVTVTAVTNITAVGAGVVVSNSAGVATLHIAGGGGGSSSGTNAQQFIITNQLERVTTLLGNATNMVVDLAGSGLQIAWPTNVFMVSFNNAPSANSLSREIQLMIICTNGQITAASFPTNDYNFQPPVMLSVPSTNIYWIQCNTNGVHIISGQELTTGTGPTVLQTNAILGGTVAVTNGVVRLTGASGPWYTELGITNGANSTNRILLSIGSNTVAAGNVLKVHATAILSSGVNVITLTNDVDNNSGGSGTTQAVVMAAGNYVVTNQILYLPREYNASNGLGLTLTNNVDMQLSTLWVNTNVTGSIGTNLVFNLSNVVQGASWITTFRGHATYSNTVTFYNGGNTGTNIKWMNWSTNGNYDILARPTYTYTVQMFANKQTNVTAWVSTDDLTPALPLVAGMNTTVNTNASTMSISSGISVYTNGTLVGTATNLILTNVHAMINGSSVGLTFTNTASGGAGTVDAITNRYASANTFTNLGGLRQEGTLTLFGPMVVTNGGSSIIGLDNAGRIDLGRVFANGDIASAIRLGTNAYIASLPQGTADTSEHLRYRLSQDNTGNSTNFVQRWWEVSNYVAVVHPPLPAAPNYGAVLSSDGSANPVWSFGTSRGGRWVIDEEFWSSDPNTDGKMGREFWQRSAGGTTAPTNNGADAFGLVAFSCRTAGTRYVYYQGLAATPGSVKFTNCQAWFQTRVMTTMLDGSGDTNTLRIGFMDSISSTEPTYGIYWRNTNNVWQLITARNGVRTINDSISNVVAGAWQELGWYLDSTGTNVIGYVGTSVTNMAPAVTNFLTIPHDGLSAPEIWVQRGLTNTTAGMTNFIDYFKLWVKQ